MRTATDHLDVFLEQAPVCIAIVDNQLRFLRVNRAMSQVYQMTLEACPGNAFVDILPILFTQIRPLLTRVLTTGEPGRTEINCTLPGRSGASHRRLAVCFPVGKAEIAIMVLEPETQSIAEALQHAHQQLQSAEADLAGSLLLTDMSHVLQGATSIKELYKVVARSAPKLFPRSAGVLGVLNSVKNTIEVAATWGDVGRPVSCLRRVLHRRLLHASKTPACSE